MTTTYVALLRGVNVGGRRRVGMGELRALFVSLGHEDVATYVQSGNVVFASPLEGPQEVAAGIEAAIAATLDLDVTVMLRTAKELSRVVDGNPFAGGPAGPGSLHVTFLARAPDPGAVGALEPAGFAPDELAVAGLEVYLHCPGGYGRSKLSNAFFERSLGVPATTRNWRTVTTLARLAAAR